jgi:phage FluMu protein Com
MTIEFRCSQCNQLLRVPDSSAGKNARCPKCSALMQVPSSEGFGAAAPPPPPPPPGPTGSGGFPSFGSSAPAAGGSDPFSFLKEGGPAAGGSSAPPPPPKSPFGDVGAGQTPNVNPYASPSGAAYAYQPSSVPQGGRPGLPWERKAQNFGTWWETTKLCMMQPTHAFSIMRQYGGMGQPMMFCAWGLGMGVLGQMVWYLPLVVLMSLAAAGQGGNGPGGGEIAMMVGVQVVTQVISGVFTVALGATLGILIGAAIGHVCLMIVGGARQGFETTLRVIGYAQGSTAWLNVIPIFGGLIAFVWLVVLEIIGFARAHEISTGKAALAVLLPMVLCFVLVFLLALLFFGVIAASLANN